MATSYVAAKEIRTSSGLHHVGDDVTTDVQNSPILPAMLAGGELVACPSTEVTATAAALKAPSSHGSSDAVGDFSPWNVFAPHNARRLTARAEDYNAKRRTTP